jgi:chemotaxis protein MotA
MNVEEGAGDLGSSMSTALVTTLYGCVLAHMIFGPIATNLRTRDEEEVLCKQIIVEGIMSIQSGENPKFLRERLETYMSQKQRGGGSGGGEGEGGEAKGGKGKKGKKE